MGCLEGKFVIFIRSKLVYHSQVTVNQKEPILKSWKDIFASKLTSAILISYVNWLLKFYALATENISSETFAQIAYKLTEATGKGSESLPRLLEFCESLWTSSGNTI